mmetsp:Transcript_16062/g.24576  ORF Transcript_16062/g.24576 Transcript_16062/m.24576 type:complete len:148 (+) Transcript_16062:37-480(+)
MRPATILAMALALFGGLQLVTAFHVHHSAGKKMNSIEMRHQTSTFGLFMAEEKKPFFADEGVVEASDEDKVKASLEEKMAQWEASEEEIKASTLGGVVPPSKERATGFDAGLYIAFPFMILGSLLFALFPFIMDKIDVSSVGPPPIV